MGTTIRIPASRQGQTGKGQGGWACYLLVSEIGQPATVALRSPVPIDTDLEVVDAGPERWTVIDPATPDIVILEATRWKSDYPDTTPVAVSVAAEARARFPLTVDTHPAPHCVSCGLGERSLHVHAGPLGDGRWATPFRAPTWSLRPDGSVEPGLLWMAMDCSCGWYTSMEGPYRRGVTVQFAVDIHEALEPETDYALVAWSGDHPPHWDGRKRGAASALFDSAGACVAQSRSFWIATP